MKKIISALLALGMILSLTACDSKPAVPVTDDSVTEFAEDFGKAMSNAKTKDFKKLCVDPDNDLIDLFENMTQQSSVKGDTSLIHEAIFTTFDYEIDEDTICLLKKGATIEMTFSVVNYNKVDPSECEDLEDYIDQLLNTKKSNVYTKELEIEVGEDRLLIVNAKDILEEVYTWEDFDIDSDEFASGATDVTEATDATEAPAETNDATKDTEATEVTEATEIAPADVGTYKDYVTATAFYDLGELAEEDAYTYVNTAYIESNLILKEGYSNLDWDEVYCDIYYNEEYVSSYYVNTVDDDFGLAATCSIGVCNHPELSDENLHYMLEGEYVFEYYDPDDNFIASNYCEVVLHGTNYTFTIEEGDSSELDNIIFADWYYIAPDYLSFEMYNQTFSYSYEYSYKLFKGDEEIFSSADFFNDRIYGDGVFSSAMVDPAYCDLDVFEKGEYRLDTYDKDGKVIYTSTFMIE